jgi:hypothetical protein
LARFHQSQLTPKQFVSQHGIGMSTLSKWLRLEREAAPAKVKFKEVRLPNPASRWPVEVTSPHGWIVPLQNGSNVKSLPDLTQVGCWAHGRRGFHEALGESKLAMWFVGQIGQRYAVEKKLREQKTGPQLRTAMRVWQSRPVLARLRQAMELVRRRALPQRFARSGD